MTGPKRPITDELGDVLAYLRLRVSGQAPRLSEPAVAAMGRVVKAALKAAKGPRVKPDDVIHRHIDELWRLIAENPSLRLEIGIIALYGQQGVEETRFLTRVKRSLVEDEPTS